MLFGHGITVFNTGGTGEAMDEAKQYQLIGPSTTNNPDSVGLAIQLYYKNNAIDEEIRELHGNIIVSATGLVDGAEMNTGIFIKPEDAETELYDGLNISWVYEYS